MSLIDAVKEGLWIKGLLSELGLVDRSTPCIQFDSQSVVHLSKNSVYH